MPKINKPLLPIKAHYFFFMAAMGPILPQINVFGRELGISPDIMGIITSVLPILFILAKPLVGFLIDYFTNLRKFIFITILLITTFSYGGFYLVPTPSNHDLKNVTLKFPQTNYMEKCSKNIQLSDICTTDVKKVNCQVICINKTNNSNESNYVPLKGYITKVDPITEGIYKNETDSMSAIENYSLCISSMSDIDNNYCDIFCNLDNNNVPDCVTGSKTFWTFVILMCLGTIGFNVTNCVSDATCFDVLGDSQNMKYGRQRVWGTIGFGLSALIGGIAVNAYKTPNNPISTIAPALIIMFFFCGLDVISIRWLNLPKMGGSDTIMRDVVKLLRRRPILIFLIFATMAGIIDSFIIYYMFWYLEDVAEKSGHMDSIKLIEGLVVAAECLGGEILFFTISGQILKRIGYVHCLSFCFFMYSIRLGLISLITNPWWLIAVEFFMQGPTYALCYTCIVAYASAVAPKGTTATVQGLVAGMDDGIGFAIGSLIGGQLYKRIGGLYSFRMFAAGALLTCVVHILFRPAHSNEITIDDTVDKQYSVPPEQTHI